MTVTHFHLHYQKLLVFLENRDELIKIVHQTKNMMSHNHHESGMSFSINGNENEEEEDSHNHNRQNQRSSRARGRNNNRTGALCTLYVLKLR